MSNHHAAPMLSRGSAALVFGCAFVAAFAAAPGGPAWPATAVAQAAPNDSAPAPIELEPVDRSELRYNGRSFREWQREFRTDLSPERRILALPALAKLGRHGHAAEAAATIAEALDDEEDIELVQAAAGHLARLGRAAAPLLVKRLKSSSRDVRLAVIKALGEIGPLAEAAVPALLPIAAAALGSEVPAVDVVLAEAAFEALKRIVTSTTPEVRQGLQSPSPSMRAVCIYLIAHSLQRSPAAERQEPVEALLKLLGDGQPTVRSAAAVALWRVAGDSPQVVDALVAAVRAAPAVSELARLLKSADAQIRSAAADVLGCIGPESRPAVGLLQELASDETPLEHPMRLGASAEAASSASFDAGAAQYGLPADTVGAHARAALLRIRPPAQ